MDRLTQQCEDLLPQARRAWLRRKNLRDEVLEVVVQCEGLLYRAEEVGDPTDLLLQVDAALAEVQNLLKPPVDQKFLTNYAAIALGTDVPIWEAIAHHLPANLDNLYFQIEALIDQKFPMFDKYEDAGELKEEVEDLPDIVWTDPEGRCSIELKQSSALIVTMTAKGQESQLLLALRPDNAIAWSYTADVGREEPISFEGHSRNVLKQVGKLITAPCTAAINSRSGLF